MFETCLFAPCLWPHYLLGISRTLRWSQLCLRSSFNLDLITLIFFLIYKIRLCLKALCGFHFLFHSYLLRIILRHSISKLTKAGICHMSGNSSCWFKIVWIFIVVKLIMNDFLLCFLRELLLHPALSDHISEKSVFFLLAQASLAILMALFLAKILTFSWRFHLPLSRRFYLALSWRFHCSLSWSFSWRFLSHIFLVKIYPSPLFWRC